MNECTYLCMYVCIHVFMSAWMDVCMYICMYVCMNVFIYVCIDLKVKKHYLALLVNFFKPIYFVLFSFI